MSEQHVYDTGEQVAELYGRLRTLAEGFTEAGSSSDFLELFTIIHSPDWTTLTDLEVVNQLVNTAERNLAEAAELRGLMLLGARPVTDESAIAA
jgi:hypothetical protein